MLSDLQRLHILLQKDRDSFVVVGHQYCHESPVQLLFYPHFRRYRSCICNGLIVLHCIGNCYTSVEQVDQVALVLFVPFRKEDVRKQYVMISKTPWYIHGNIRGAYFVRKLSDSSYLAISPLILLRNQNIFTGPA